MEILIILIILAVLCLALGISEYYIIMAVFGLIGLTAVLMSVIFLYCFFRLLAAKRKTAKFLRFEPIGKSKFMLAVYEADGEEYPCIFPEEGIFRSRLYRTDRPCHVMLNRQTRKVFDCFAVTTTVLGLILGIAMSVGMVLFFLGI